MQNSFVYDDESTIINNYFIRHWSNFPNLFTGKYFVLSAELTYRPVVTLLYFIDYTFWRLNPLGYHLTNILLHAMNSTLFFIFAFRVLKKRSMALVAALFFSSFPVFSEAVNAIGFREDVMAFLFLILAFIFYLKAGQFRYVLYYPLSLICYFLSLFSKEMAITLPLLIVLYDLFFQGLLLRNDNLPLSKEGEGEIGFSYLKSKILHYYLGYFLVTVFYALTRFYFLYNPQESHIPYPQYSLIVNFLTIVHVLAYYVKLLFLPFQLNADYVVPFTASPVKVSFWLSLLLFIAIGVFTFRLRSQHKHIFFFILWFFVTLIPVMNIVPLGNIMAERYLYIPGAGFCMIVACLLSKRQGFFIFVLFFILMGNSCLTLWRNNDWKDGLQLWSKTILTSPNSFRAHINLGNAYEKKGLNTAAFEEYQKALSLDPNDADVYNNLGIYYNKMNLFEDAIQHFTKCLNINPRHARAYNNLGVVLTRQKRLDDAIQAFKQAISMNPLYPDAHNNLGIAYYRKGLMEDAEREFKLTINIEPYHAEAHNDLGILYTDKHLYDDAIYEFETATRIKPDYANAHMNLGAVILRHRKDIDRALFHLKESIKIAPRQEQAAGIKKLIQQLEYTAE
ncbi:MAG: tetratricopeptide repeat protein [Candidatus Brocadia sp.]